MSLVTGEELLRFKEYLRENNQFIEELINDITLVALKNEYYHLRVKISNLQIGEENLVFILKILKYYTFKPSNEYLLIFWDEIECKNYIQKSNENKKQIETKEE